MDKWLQSRLTPAKQQNARWLGYAQVLEKIWESDYLPFLDRYQRMKSSFQADDQDLAKLIAQMGDYFSYDTPQEESRAIALAWRRLELEYKDLELILSMALRRHFGSLEIEWIPLYAPKDKPYGTEYLEYDHVLQAGQNKNIPPDGYFLTSRGNVAINKLTIAQNSYLKDEIREDAIAVIKRVKPIDRIFENLSWYEEWPIIFDEVDWSRSWWEVDEWVDLEEGGFTTDIDVLRNESDIVFKQDFLPRDNPLLYWPLDYVPREGYFPPDLVPVVGFKPVMSWPFYLDRPLKGYEGLEISPLGICVSETRLKWEAKAVAGELDTATELETDMGEMPIDLVAGDLMAEGEESWETEAAPHIEYVRHSPRRLDMLPLFKDIAADWMPLDTPLGGFINVI